MKPIITIDGIGKKYQIGSREPYLSLRDSLTQALRTFGRQPKAEFWALRDVSFNIGQGESLGIVGRNGAGKSTLLKILSQITPPTTGTVTMRGRVASLLEVGTGFHPELTGRENIFLNGAILGMSQAEIKQKFDEIVDFAGVEKFLETPVKRYSSGMYVRLAFAVAAHLEPEILIVDEVLAVGDSEFQKKCLGKMEQVTRQDGRTILFVSHNLLAVQNLCQKTALIENGRLKKLGPTSDVLDLYLNGDAQAESQAAERHEIGRDGEGKNIRFTAITVANADGSGRIKSHDGLTITADYVSDLAEPIKDGQLVLSIVSETTHQLMLRMDSDVTAQTFTKALKPTGRIVCQTAGTNLMEGRYMINLDFLVKGENQVHIEQISPFEVVTELKSYRYKNPPDKYAADYLTSYRFKQS